MTSVAAPETLRRWLIGTETLTGALATAGGILLMARPDGTLIGARTAVLDGSPFTTWLVPGLLLLVFVGGGFLGSALYIAEGGRFAPTLSIAAGVGLVAFETCEVVWLGLQPLELIFAAVGVAVVAMGLRLRTSDRR